MQKALGRESMEGCNPSRSIIALLKEGILSSNTYTSKSLPYGIQMGFHPEMEREQRGGEIQSEACSTRVHAETQH